MASPGNRRGRNARPRLLTCIQVALPELPIDSSGRRSGARARHAPRVLMATYAGRCDRTAGGSGVEAEIGLFRLAAALQILGEAVQDDVAGAHDIDAVGDRQRALGALLDDQ